MNCKHESLSFVSCSTEHAPKELATWCDDCGALQLAGMKGWYQPARKSQVPNKPAENPLLEPYAKTCEWCGGEMCKVFTRRGVWCNIFNKEISPIKL